MAVKKVSEFPVVEAIGIHVFGRSPSNKNVQVLLDVKQSIGDSTTSLMSQKAIKDAIGIVQSNIETLEQSTSNSIGIINTNIDTLGSALNKVSSKTGKDIKIGIAITDPSDPTNNTIIASSEDSIGNAVQKAVEHLNSIGVGAVTGIKSPHGTIAVGIDEEAQVTTIDVATSKLLSIKEDNLLHMDEDGKLYYKGDNYWIYL